MLRQLLAERFKLALHVNNIGFHFPGGEFAPGIVALVTPDGSVRRVADGVAFPNGMVVTPDNSTLILAESYDTKLTAFDIAADGRLSNRRVWADLAGGAPDGICLAQMAVWYGDVPNKRCGANGTTLFLMAAEWRGATNMHDATRTGQVLSVQAPAPHVGWP
jgi:SMP-30/gluconolaconase/LRE-like protein